MRYLWVVCRLIPVPGNTDGAKSIEINGVFSTKEKALGICRDEKTAAVPFELDRDYSDVTEFLVASAANPSGVTVGAAEARAHFHANAMDAASAKQFFGTHSKTIGEALNQAVKKGSGGLA